MTDKRIKYEVKKGGSKTIEADKTKQTKAKKEGVKNASSS